MVTSFPSLSSWCRRGRHQHVLAPAPGACDPLFLLLLATFVLLTLTSTTAWAYGDRPVIGVLTVPVSMSEECETINMQRMARAATATATTANATNAAASSSATTTSPVTSCFEAFYVSWLESAGLRVAVIPYNAPQDKFDELLANVNGILFTGGGLSLLMNTTYYQRAHAAYEYVLEENRSGRHMVLWGTCMGFQLLNVLTANDESVLERYAFDSEHLSLPLDLVQPAARASRLLGSAPPDIYRILSQEPVTSNLHHDGIPPSRFQASARLTDFYNVLSTNVDRKGSTFISTIEGKTAPVYGVQWHPERPQYEWVIANNISHTMDAVRAMAYTAQFLGAEVRKSPRHWNQSLAPEYMIYSHLRQPNPSGGSFQYYIFGPEGKSLAWA